MNINIFNFFFSLSLIPSIASFALLISNVLIYIFIVTAIIIPIFVRRDFIYSMLVLGTGAGAWIVAYIIKHIFMEPRPFVTLHIVPLFMETGFSFPSSHVTVISALTVLIWNINRKLGILFLIFTLFTAFSRMIIGVHYPVDVFAGACFGVVIGLCIVWLNKVTKQFAFLRKYI